MSHEPIAYIYEASEHCPACAFLRFGRDEHGTVPEAATDREGNFIGAVFRWDAFDDRDMSCGTCGTLIHEVWKGAA